MNKTVKLTIVVALALLIVTPALAEVGFFSYIEELTELAINNSKQLKIDQLSVEINESLLEDAQDEAEKNDYPGGDRTERLKRRIIVEVDTLNAETALEVAKRTQVDNEAQLASDVYQATMDVLLAAEQLEVEQAKLEIAKALQELATAQHEAGVITQTDLFEKDYQVDDQRVAVQVAQDTLDSSKFELNKLRGLPLSQEVNIEAALVLDEFAPQVENLVSIALETDTHLYESMRQLEAQQLKLELTAEEYRPYAKEYKQASYDKQAAEISVQQAEQDLETAIRNDYNDFLNRKDNYELAEQFYKLAAKKLAVAELKQEQGMIGLAEYLAEKSNYLDAEYSLAKAICDYNKSKSELELYSKGSIIE